MSEKLIFAQTVEGLLRALGPLNEQDRRALNNPNARVMINYVMSNLHRVGDVDTVEVRFQVCF